MQLDIAHIVRRIKSPYRRGIDVGEGWHKIIIDLDKRLAEIDPNYTLLQCKEKFGALRYYTSARIAAAENFRAAIREAEIASARTCETCGNPGQPRDGAWLKTLCDEHSHGRPVLPTEDEDAA